MAGLSQDVAGTAEWLVNKLHHDDAWNAHSIAAGLTHNTLSNITQCFGLLDAQVRILLVPALQITRSSSHQIKIKVLMSLLSMREADRVRHADVIDSVLALAADDSDEWVR